MDEGEHLLRERLAMIEAELQARAVDLERRLEARRELIEEQLAGLRAQQQAALEASDRRFESERLQGAKRDELISSRISAHEGRIEKLEREASVSEGAQRRAAELKTSTIAYVGLFVAIASVIVLLIVNHILR